MVHRFKRQKSNIPEPQRSYPIWRYREITDYWKRQRARHESPDEDDYEGISCNESDEQLWALGEYRLNAFRQIKQRVKAREAEQERKVNAIFDSLWQSTPPRLRYGFEPQLEPISISGQRYRLYSSDYVERYYKYGKINPCKYVEFYTMPDDMKSEY